jgi:hypothetical protein
MTPFEAIYGHKPPSILSYLPCASKVRAVDLTLTAREDILHTVKENLVMAQNHMKQQADQGRSECQFVEGDQVFLRLQPYKKTSLKAEHCQKLEPKILWSLYHSQACGASSLSVSFAQPFEATSCFSRFMLKEGDWS